MEHHRGIVPRTVRHGGKIQHEGQALQTSVHPRVRGVRVHSPLDRKSNSAT